VTDNVEERVARHYARSDLEAAILDALVASGKDLERLVPEDLAPVDEFHTAEGRPPSSSPRRSISRPTCTSWTSAVASVARRDFSQRSMAVA
jgi:hypothetical protein